MPINTLEEDDMKSMTQAQFMEAVTDLLAEAEQGVIGPELLKIAIQALAEITKFDTRQA